MQFCKLFVFIVVLSFNHLAWAAGNIDAGSKLYRRCIACHGKQGEGKKSQKAPRLAGQYVWYLKSQIKNIKQKVRSVPKMYPFVKTLSSQEIEDLAAYIGQL